MNIKYRRYGVALMVTLLAVSLSACGSETRHTSVRPGPKIAATETAYLNDVARDLQTAVTAAFGSHNQQLADLWLNKLGMAACTGGHLGDSAGQVQVLVQSAALSGVDIQLTLAELKEVIAAAESSGMCRTAKLVAVPVTTVPGSKPATITVAASLAQSQVQIAPVPGASGLKPGSYFDFKLQAGQSAAAHATIQNHGAAAPSVMLYTVPGTTSSRTGATYSGYASEANVAQGWVSPEVDGEQTNTFALAAGEQSAVDIAVAVPSGAPPGDYLVGVAVQVPQAISTTDPVALVSSSPQAQSVVGVLIDVPGNGPGFTLKLGEPQITRGESGADLVSTPLSSTGNRLGAPREDIWVTGSSSGDLLGRQLSTILPGTNTQGQVPWPTTLAAGIYQVKFCVYGGGLLRRICRTGAAVPTLQTTTTTIAPPALPATSAPTTVTTIPVTPTASPNTTAPNVAPTALRTTTTVPGVIPSSTAVRTTPSSVTPSSVTPPTAHTTVSPSQTIPPIKPGTQPQDVALTAACAAAVAPAEKMIHTMHSGAILTPAETATLNRVLAAAPKACSTAAEIKSGRIGSQYTQWQYKDLLPWMRLPVHS